MVQVQDDDYVPPDFTVTTSSGGSDTTITITDGKVKRTRKPWVYKSKYDILERRYVIAKWLAFTGWAAFILIAISKMLW